MTDTGGDHERAAALVERARRDVEKGWLPACQLAVARRGELVVFETIGDAQDDTHFCIFSATKPFVAAGVWLLIGDGDLDVARPVAEYIPAFGTLGKESVTIEQVLLHTSGFPSAPMWPEEGADRERRLKRFSTWPLEWAPGTHFIYHAQSAHWVLAELIDSISGEDYRSFLDRRICAPLGLGRILGTSVGDQPRVAPLTWVGKGAGTEGSGDLTFEWDSPATIAAGSPGGGGIATAAEMALFYQGLLNNPGGIWDPDVLADGTGNVRCTLPDPLMKVAANRTLGLVVAGDDGLHTMRYGAFAETNSPRAFGHAGAHVQVAWADPVGGISFCYLTNGLDTDMMREGVRGLKLSNLAARFAQPGTG